MALEGIRKEQCGRYDFYIQLAERYHWTPEQIDSLDPDYVEELRAFLAGYNEHIKLQRKREERRQKKRSKD